MEAGNRGAQKPAVSPSGSGSSFRTNREMNEYVDLGVDFRYFFARKTMS